MRTGLTILAIVLIWTLTAALVGPYFVDWSKQREAVEAQLSRVLGDRVTVGGAIDLKLLPSPYIILNQVRVVDPKSQEVVFSCDEMEMTLGLTSLARGEFRFTEASFFGPVIHVSRGSDGRILLPKLDMETRTESVAFDKVVIRDGRLTIAPAEGLAQLDLHGIDLDAEAGSLLGPFKGSGALTRPGGQKASFSFASGAVEAGKLRFKAVVNPGGELPRADLEGALSFAAATPMSGVAALDYSGSATFAGIIEGVAAPMPWRASGALKADLRGATLDGLEVRLGQEDRAISATGSAHAQFGPQARMSISLAAKQLNLDALLRPEGEESATPARAYQALRASLAELSADIAPPFPVSLDLTTPAAILGGDTITEVSLSAAAGPDAMIAGRLEASPPGRSHILASGAIDLGPAPVFRGRVDASVGDAPRLGEWLALGAPNAAARFAAVGAVLPYRSVSAIADVDISSTSFAARNLSLVLERSTLVGTLVMTRPVGTERGRMFMDLRTDSLDIDSFPNVGASADFLGGLDLSLALEARAIHVARLGEAQVEGGSLALKLTKQGNDLELERCSIADLGGATVEASGAVDAHGRWLNAQIDAARLRDFALLVHRVAPGSLSDMLVDRSGVLSPARLSIRASGRGDDPSAPPDSVTIEGAMGVTRVSAKLNRDAGALTAAVTLDAPDAAPLLRQIGLPALSLAGLGRGHLDASVHGRWGDDLEGGFTSSLAGADIDWHGRLSSKGGESAGLELEGAASIKAGDAMPFLAVLGIASPGSTPAVPTDLSAAVTWRGNRLDVAQLRGSVGHARLAGALSYSPAAELPAPTIEADPDIALAQSVVGDSSAPPAAQIEGALSIDRLSLSAVTGLALGAPQPIKAGALWSDARFAPGLVNPPSADIAVKIGAVDLADDLFGQDAGMRLRLSRGVVSLDDLSIRLAGAAVAAHATIRRDGPNASLSGQVSVEPIVLNRPNFTGRVSGSMEFAGSGQSAATLVAGLAGTGQIRLAGGRLSRLDRGALGRIIEKAQSSDDPIDQTVVEHALEAELNKGALPIADANAPAALTGGIIRFGPFETRDPKEDVLLRADFDMRSFVLDISAGVTEFQTPKYWSGAAPSVNVVFKGPIDALVRQLDASLFVAGLAAQAIARETERIAALESDMRERAFFNRRLKAGQFMHRRELELLDYPTEQARLRSEADRRRVEAQAFRTDEERRRAMAPQQSDTPVPAATMSAPTESQDLPMPLSRPQNAPQPSDPTASGFY